MMNTTTQIRRLLWITILIDMALVSLIVMLPEPTHALPAIELHVCLNGCPYASIQAAVDAAQPGDTVKVAAGTYTGVNVRPRYDVVTTGVVTQLVYLVKTVTIQGGYTTTNWTTPYPDANPTTLDAEGKGRVLYIAGNISPTIAGLRLTGGNAASLGGAICCDPVQEFDEGGGVYVITATVTISHNQIFSNTTPYDGGGIYTHQSTVTLNINMVFSNTAKAGGGLFLDYSPATIIGNHITSNTTTFEDHHHGGGLYLNSSPVTFANNTIAANQASGLGGGLTLYYSDATFDSDIISGNTSGSSGGGVMAWLSRVLLTKVKVISNTATGLGGGVQLYYATGTLVNSMIADNQTADTASGMNLAASEAHLMHTTIARNHGGDGSALRVDLGCYRWCRPSHVEAIDTIIVSHTLGITVGRETAWGVNSVVLDHVLWFGNGVDTAGAGVITITQPVIGDPTFAADGYHLRFGSAAIDQGIDTGVYTDIDDEPRFMGISYDLGADEFATGLLVAQQATPPVMQAGGQVTYTISVTNVRAVDLTTIVTDTLPEHIVSAQTPSGLPIVPGSTITWTPMISASGGVWTQTVIITAATGYIGPLTNLITATAEGNAIGSNAFTITIVKPQVFVSLIMRQ